MSVNLVDTTFNNKKLRKNKTDLICFNIYRILQNTSKYISPDYLTFQSGVYKDDLVWRLAFEKHGEEEEETDQGHWKRRQRLLSTVDQTSILYHR